MSTTCSFFFFNHTVQTCFCLYDYYYFMGSDIRTLSLQENGEDDEQDDDDGNEGDS